MRKTCETLSAMEIPVGGVTLRGDLSLSAASVGLVIFVHGSGSGRGSPRNRFVAERLQQAGLATLLMDLLTQHEEDQDRITRTLRFDIDLLAGRVAGAMEWIHANKAVRGMPMGLFGASTGAAAALRVAADRPKEVAAVVSRGGRPDLAGEALERLRTPTLLIVGGEDDVVLDLNRQALRKMTCPCRLTVVDGATHLFEEPWALEQVSELAGKWFSNYLSGRRSPT